jgi:hypothetical protein
MIMEYGLVMLKKMGDMAFSVSQKCDTLSLRPSATSHYFGLEKSILPSRKGDFIFYEYHRAETLC